MPWTLTRWPRLDLRYVGIVGFVLLAAIWVLSAPATPDLAAQVYRAHLFAAHPFALYDAGWYGGHLLPAYGVLFPASAAVLGVRVAGALASVAAVVAFDRLARSRFGARASVGTAWFALLVAMNLLSARLTFALGLALGLGALLAAARGRRAVALGLAALCPLGSPLAALFLIVAAGTWWVAERRSLPMLLIGVAAVPLLAVEIAFPEGGTFAFGLFDLVALIAVLAAGIVLLPRSERALRLGFAAYAALALGAYLVPSPVGSNATRLGLIACGPLLACALSGRRAALLAACSPALLAWSWGPTAQDLQSVGTPATTAAYYRPLTAFLARQGPHPFRLEIPFTRGHWESTFVAGRFMLARGWERQLDRRVNPIFYRDAQHPLGPAGYHAWLRAQAVSYVALPDAALDRSALGERAVIRSRPAYLRELWHSRDWTVFAVRDPLPLLSGPGRLVGQDGDSLSIAVRRPGRFLLRMHYSPYWELPAAAGCAGPAPGGWTALTFTRPGRYRLTSRFDLRQAADADSTCPAPSGRAT